MYPLQYFALKQPIDFNFILNNILKINEIVANFLATEPK